MSEAPASKGVDRANIRLQIYRGARLDANYIVMNSLATVVAGYGLLADSTAVVIGAMLMAMLLGPILGLALGLIDGDTRLLVRAAVAEAAGVALVLTLGFGIGLLNADLPITREILARTQPNVLDLGIALAGGAAASYAMCVPRVSASMVGVAIATALAPPLTACGICLSRGLFGEAAGAFLMFFINLVAIQFSSSVVLAAFGLHGFWGERAKQPGYWRRLGVDIGLLLLLAIFLSNRLSHTVSRQKAEDLVRRTLDASLAGIPGARLVETRIAEVGEGRRVVAVVRSPRAVRPSEVAAAESELTSALGAPVALRVRSVLTEEATRDGLIRARVSTEESEWEWHALSQ